MHPNLSVEILNQSPIGLAVDGATNLKYKLMCFFAPNKIILQEKSVSF
jgi:hypothetical protein